MHRKIQLFHNKIQVSAVAKQQMHCRMELMRFAVSTLEQVIETLTSLELTIQEEAICRLQRDSYSLTTDNMLRA